ncbi:MAG: formaldehyde-activating enzyme [Deltaproteobacteria bacterium]|nr:formaldehyde-activating enzyme [Deltaproteobacteria bacterium]
MSIARPEIEIGEAFVGDGFDAAHVNTVIGKREGTVGSAWAQALATPTTGHAPFIAVLQPGLPVKPYTLIIASVWVNPEATDERAVYRNNRDATRAALAAGSQQVPKIDEVLDARDAPENPNFRLG